MKSQLICLFAFGWFASSVLAQYRPDLTNPNQKYNYVFGIDIVSTFQQQDVDIDLKAFMAGMRDALAGKAALTEDQQKAALKELSDAVMAKAEAQWKAAAVKNLKNGEAFMAGNAGKEGVRKKEVTAPDGSKVDLQYRILKSGPPGPSPGKDDIVEVHYTGTLADGTVIDDSVKRGVPATFGMTQVIPGWMEALKMMRAGDKWQLFIPVKLGYGEVAPPHIGPNQALIYEIELLSFYTPKRDEPPR